MIGAKNEATCVAKPLVSVEEKGAGKKGRKKKLNIG
jgi:hypothetical protein